MATICGDKPRPVRIALKRAPSSTRYSSEMDMVGLSHRKPEGGGPGQGGGWAGSGNVPRIDIVWNTELERAHRADVSCREVKSAIALFVA
jgi:hypothetical protein